MIRNEETLTTEVLFIYITGGRHDNVYCVEMSKSKQREWDEMMEETAEV